MPPKNKKTAEKVKKVVEDKTFGLKNKNKSSKVQKYIQQVQQQATQNVSKKKEPTKKELETKKKEEFNELFKPVQVQKVPFGVDPKTVLCQFFKGGTCTKGKACKFSHDQNIERKSAKIDLYTDARNDKKDEGMENWDQATLEDVINKKHTKQPPTDIVCKFFLQAVEDKKYGWFWVCPNGDDCKYKHALPPGFVLKDQKKKKTDEPVQTLEEWIEEERGKLPVKLTPVTLESFTKWKNEREEKKRKEEEEKNKQREQAIKAGRSIGASGRELFTYNPDLIGDDEEAMEIDYTQREDDADLDEAKGGDIDESLFEGEDLENLDIDDDDEEEEEDEDTGVGSSSKAAQ